MSTAVVAVTALAIMQFVFFGALVSRYRVTLGVQAPAMTGPPQFEHMVRVHLNTQERLVVFLPLLWMASTVWRADAAAALGVVFLLGRHLYWRGYMQGPARRTLGNIVSMLPTAALLLIVLFGVAHRAIG